MLHLIFTTRMVSLCQRRAKILENHLHGVARSFPCKIYMHLFLFVHGALYILRQEELYSPGPEASL